jgi:catechol 2,3-dioxygenase-like lactoylglutathione lyase family enzyme
VQNAEYSVADGGAGGYGGGVVIECSAPAMTIGFPSLRSVVLDTTDARALAEFYRQLLGYRYRLGDEPPGLGESDPNRTDWLVLIAPDGRGRLAFQQVDRLQQPTWPDPTVPQQLHLDLAVASSEDLAAQHQRVLALGARFLHDRFDDPDEPLYVYADPSGHPFCVFVATDSQT